MPKAKTKFVVVSVERTADLLNKLCVLKQMEKKIRAELFAAARAAGPLQGAGFWVDERQTIYEAAPRADALAEAFLATTPKPDQFASLQQIFNCIPITTKLSMLKKLPQASVWQSFMAEECTNGGVEVLYGKPRMDVRNSEAKEGKHRVILPGEVAYEGGEE